MYTPRKVCPLPMYTFIEVVVPQELNSLTSKLSPLFNLKIPLLWAVASLPPPTCPKSIPWPLVCTEKRSGIVGGEARK